MGNIGLACFQAPQEMVKVVLLNGEVQEFKGLVTASMVMKQYPQHLVIYCTRTTTRENGTRRRVEVLRPEQTLKVNRNYLIMPTQSVGNQAFLDSWAFFALSTTRAKKCVRRQAREKRCRCIKTMLAKLFSSHFANMSNHGEETKSLLDFGKTGHHAKPPKFGYYCKSGYAKARVRPACTGNPTKDWRPSLDRIPESPLISPEVSRAGSYARRT